MIKARASQDRINEILDLDEVINEASNAQVCKSFTKDILFEDVSFNYEQNKVLDGITFTIKKGQNIALVGESGSGKTTLINLIPRFYNTSSGSIYLDGRKTDSLLIKDLRGMMSLVSQDPILFNSSVAENIAFGDTEPDMARVIEAAKIANAHTFIEKMAGGYKNIIGDIRK